LGDVTTCQALVHLLRLLDFLFHLLIFLGPAMSQPLDDEVFLQLHHRELEFGVICTFAFFDCWYICSATVASLLSARTLSK
jgi:hypothetical protein